MQTDEEVGKVAQAVPVIIYILFIAPKQTFSAVKFSLTPLTSHLGVVCRVAANQIDANNTVTKRKNTDSVPHEAVHSVGKSLRFSEGLGEEHTRCKHPGG